MDQKGEEENLRQTRIDLTFASYVHTYFKPDEDWI